MLHISGAQYHLPLDYHFGEPISTKKSSTGQGRSSPNPQKLEI